MDLYPFQLRPDESNVIELYLSVINVILALVEQLLSGTSSHELWVEPLEPASSSDGIPLLQFRAAYDDCFNGHLELIWNEEDGEPNNKRLEINGTSVIGASSHDDGSSKAFTLLISPYCHFLTLKGLIYNLAKNDKTTMDVLLDALGLNMSSGTTRSGFDRRSAVHLLQTQNRESTTRRSLSVAVGAW